ncbi:hypothetical protein NTE_03361 [Candidatus Nitrososphaera evergladensis SR1]|uniref:Uncharacterized protein n=1 Tax=Candidatus Nitrososphaera evergladensis SR1 TaxID=1459636 RepID=A0A075N1Q3_9ARCH|nr:hypothetical protein NTE_03361 [Candidatus Nitrososphaera evergladensis SR1]
MYVYEIARNRSQYHKMLFVTMHIASGTSEGQLSYFPTADLP